jgi:hypothetical protein
LIIKEIGGIKKIPTIKNENENTTYKNSWEILPGK